MHSFLTGLGVPVELQAHLNISEPLFSYGNDIEYFGPGIHLVPTTPHLWMAGNTMAKEVIVTSAAMEAIAFLVLNVHRYPLLSSITLIALGNLPHPGQLAWLRTNCQKRKITLVFGNDLLGRLADIIVAAGIRNKPVRLHWGRERVWVTAASRHFEADPDYLTLNTFEKACGIRTGIRTSKPNHFDTYLQQLKYDNKF
jgi:hypothetical protein